MIAPYESSASRGGATPHSSATLEGDPTTAAYADPPRECDVVMKGGITSGIVYPLAVCELASAYRFRSIGGTSAGAIAAAATAAAEYRRRQATVRGLPDDEQGEGFRRLAELPRTLGRDDFLFSLFQPQPATAPLFRALTAWLGPRRGRLLRGVGAAVASFAAYAVPAALLLAAVAVVPAVLLWATHPRVALAFALLGVGLLALGAVAGAAAGMTRSALGAVPSNGFGLCSGGPGVGADRHPALTAWLTTYLNDLAGKPLAEGPLTFGDLWYADLPPGTRRPAREERAIDLQMMTSCVSLGRPYRLPFEERIFSIDLRDAGALFPASVVEWLRDHQRRAPGASDDEPAAGVAAGPAAASIVALPAPEDLPVIVAVRLSLSFPILLSAVRLQATDFTRKNVEDRVPEPCWFSDGGLCSNFPVHFFDDLLPRRPTFGINLHPYHPDYPETDAYMPKRAGDGVAESWNRFDHPAPRAGSAGGPGPTGAARLLGFVGALLSTAKDWRDNMQLHLPGYRERVVAVHLHDDEGGLNLTMPAEVIAAVSERGRQAGALLRARYAGPAATAGPAGRGGDSGGVAISWESHRWTRYRSAMAALHRMLGQFAAAFNAPPAPGERSYASLIAPRASEAPPACYPWRAPLTGDAALAATRELASLGERWRVDGPDFGEASRPPHPPPDLRATPHL